MQISSMKGRLWLTAALCCISAATMEAGTGAMKKDFGKTPDGKTVEIYTLRNHKGMEAQIMTFGAIVVSLKVPDKGGRIDDVVLGFDDLDHYVRQTTYFGAVVGRYGNRIAKGQFTLDGKTYHLPINDGPNTLHGGKVGFDKHVWKADNATDHSLELSYLSKDGEEGFPGNLTVHVTYTVTENNELRLDYKATTDKDTVLNVTNHSYFNLSGAGNGDILHHELSINADKFTPVDATLIPTGELKPVDGTPFDFKQVHLIGSRINGNDQQLKYGHGYDHNWVLNGASGAAPRAAVHVHDPKSGRVLDVSTDQPGVQFYTGNFLDGTVKGKGGKVYPRRGALCLETQHFPDSPNHPNFPSTELKPGQTYKSTTIFKFSVQ